MLLPDAYDYGWSYAPHIRPYVYEFLKPFQPINQFITIFCYRNGLLAAYSYLQSSLEFEIGRKAPRNPACKYVEWAAPGHPGHGNFDRDITVYRGPYEFVSPESKRDYLPVVDSSCTHRAGNLCRRKALIIKEDVPKQAGHAYVSFLFGNLLSEAKTALVFTSE